MIVVGLNTFIKNPAACILIDGKLTAFAEEERFVRVKSADGYFPGCSIKYCLHEAKLSLSDIDAIAVSWDCCKYVLYMPYFMAKSAVRYFNISKNQSVGRAVSELIKFNPKLFREKIKYGLRQAGISGKIPPIEFISHHLSHAASTYFASGFDSANILVVDGSGEERATSIYLGKDSKIEELYHIDIPHSLGWFYAAISSFLGFTPYIEDGFLMGLSSYGKRNSELEEKMDKVLSIAKDGQYFVNPESTLLGLHSFSEYFSDKLVKILGSPRLRNEPITKDHKNIAYQAQEKLEEAFLALVKKAVRKTKTKNLCLAGGVSLNCKANGKILRSSFVDRMFVQPLSHDAGGALGAAMIVAQKGGDNPRHKMRHVRWGPSFSSGEIKKILDCGGVSYKVPRSIEKKAAEKIAKGKIVARFEGRMEAGPRALGGRSILAAATKKGIKDYINKRVKKRDPWRPFAPSIPAEYAKDYYQGGEESRFMTVAYKVKRGKEQEIEDVLHVDKTLRPQSVEKDIDPKYYRLIEAVGEKTDVPAVLNTSLNVKGEPIAQSPEDAIRCFASTGIDALALGDFWIEKR